MKVALLVDTWFPTVGGGQTNAYEISKRIASKKFQIDVITRNSGKDKTEYPPYLRVIKLGNRTNPNSIFSKIVFLLSSFFYVYKNDYDLVHAHAFLPGISARMIQSFKGIPSILTVHGTSINTNLLNPIVKQLEKFIFTQIQYTAQITVSRDFQNIKNVNRNIFYIPNGANFPKTDQKVRKTKNPTLLFVGRLHKQKNLENLIKSISIVQKTYPKILLKIVGDGVEKSNLQKIVIENNLKLNITFLGELSIKKLKNLYLSSHFLILPSIYEGQPLVVLEAWAHHLPVITSKTGDLPYMLKNGQNGYLIPNHLNPKSIAETIGKAFSKGALTKLKDSKYQTAKNNYNWQKSAQRTQAIYEKVTRS